MKHWTASVAAILLAGFPVVAGAQVNCEAIPHGPARRLLPWPKSVLSWTIGPCRWEGARAIRRRVVSGNYRNKPSKTETTPATIKTQTIPAGDWKTSIIAPSFDLISPNPRQPQSRRPLKSVVRRSIERSFGDFD